MVLPLQQRFPLEPICCFVGTKQMTLDTSPQLRFWAYKQIAHRVFDRCKLLDADQFDLLAWKYVHVVLEEVPRLLQLWACKQVMSITATNGLQTQ
jgi:hypothetical protein